MKRPYYLVLLPLLLAATVRAGLEVNTGSLLIRGGKLESDALQINDGASLYGNGTLVAPSILLDGITAPCGEYPAETGTLSFDGPVELAGLYLCKANANADVDLLSASGAFSGAALVQMETNNGAIPLDQPIISGSALSDMTGFTLVSGQQPFFQLTESGSKNLLVTDLTGDTNTNGIPDWWENHYFGGRTNGTAAADADGDQADNLNEYGAGTDPTNAASCFAIAQFEVRAVDSGTIIRWNSVAGKTYAIERTTNLLTAAFAPVFTNIAATPPSNTWTNLGASAAALYYRIVVEP